MTDNEWKRSYHNKVFSRFKRELLSDLSEWKGISRASRALPWKPITTGSGTVELHEALDDGGSAAVYLDSLSLDAEPDVHALIARAEGLLLLSADQDSEKDEVMSTNEMAGFDVAGSAHLSTMIVPTHASLRVAPLVGDYNDDRLQMLVKKRAAELNKSDRAMTSTLINTTSTNLDMFMLLQGKPTLKVPSTCLPQSRPLEDAPIADGVLDAIKTRVGGVGASEDEEPLPTMQIRWKDREAQIVASKSLLAHPDPARRLQSLLPSLDIIERDDLAEGLNTVQQSTCNLEADITLSPSTGLILTSLQRLNQTRLPGQTSYFGIRDRLVAVSTRYEHLVVLVSHSQSVPLDQTACESYSAFLAFTTNLDCVIEVHYVVGGEEELVTWIAASITQYSKMTTEFKLLRDETLWEIFLRRAGMNAFAAQVLLAKLKAASDAPSGNEAFGLAVFVIDTPQDRLTKLEALLGGAKVLQQTGYVVDAEWSYASMMPRGDRRT